jgi:hypothetical protein
MEGEAPQVSPSRAKSGAKQRRTKADEDAAGGGCQLA